MKRDAGMRSLPLWWNLPFIPLYIVLPPLSTVIHYLRGRRDAVSSQHFQRGEQRLQAKRTLLVHRLLRGQAAVAVLVAWWVTFWCLLKLQVLEKGGWMKERKTEIGRWKHECIMGICFSPWRRKASAPHSFIERVCVCESVFVRVGACCQCTSRQKTAKLLSPAFTGVEPCWFLFTVQTQRTVPVNSRPEVSQS